MAALKPRLDELLVARRLFDNIHDAQVAVLAGEVVVGEHRETCAGKRLKPDVAIRLKNRASFVSRGGEKLKGALESFSMDVRGLRAADLGCSTGGFTDCLLKAGVASVSAIDVGYGQFSWELRGDPRVSLFERTNVRNIDVAAVGGPFELVVGDLSFVSLKSLMPDIARMLAPRGQLAILVKPQFELDSSMVGDGGIVREPALHELALTRAAAAAVECGLDVDDVACSPVRGTKGNVEFLMHAVREAAPGKAGRLLLPKGRVEQTVARAHA